MLGGLLGAALVFGNHMPAMAASGHFTSDTKDTVIVIDAGHGGEAEGTKSEYDGQLILEKDLNLKIAMSLKDELENYEHVKILMVREGDVDVENQARADFAYENKADYYISIHCNATGDENEDPSGIMVLAPVGHYQIKGAANPNIYGVTTIMARDVLDSLATLGLKISPDFPEFSTNGIVRRPYTPEGGTREAKYYPDDTVADYYSQMRFNTEYGIPAILIEHAYVSNESDYRNYLSTDEKLEKLAFADAKGIAKALKLKRKELG